MLRLSLLWSNTGFLLLKWLRLLVCQEGEVAARAAATVPYGQATLLGDTWVQPNYQVTGSGEDQQIGRD